MAKLSVRDLDVGGKRVLVRVDFNVPTETRGGKVRVTDDTRIRESLATINYLREHGAKTILMSHFGRPKGKTVEKFSMRPIRELLYALMETAATIRSCGAIANTFLKSQGMRIGASRVELDTVDLARELLDLAKHREVKFLVPIDVVEADELRAGADMRNTSRLSP